MIVRSGGALPVRQQDESPGHAEMHDHQLFGTWARGEPDQDVFGPALDAGDLAARDAAFEIARQRLAQVGAALLHLLDAPADDVRAQTADHGFDFGKFRPGRAT